MKSDEVSSQVVKSDDTGGKMFHTVDDLFFSVNCELGGLQSVY